MGAHILDSGSSNKRFPGQSNRKVGGLSDSLLQGSFVPQQIEYCPTVFRAIRRLAILNGLMINSSTLAAD